MVCVSTATSDRSDPLPPRPHPYRWGDLTQFFPYFLGFAGLVNFSLVFRFLKTYFIYNAEVVDGRLRGVDYEGKAVKRGNCRRNKGVVENLHGFANVFQYPFTI